MRPNEAMALGAVVLIGIALAVTAPSWPIRAGAIFIAVVSALIGLRDEIVAEIDRHEDRRPLSLPLGVLVGHWLRRMGGDS